MKNSLSKPKNTSPPDGLITGSTLTCHHHEDKPGLNITNSTHINPTSWHLDPNHAHSKESCNNPDLDSTDFDKMSSTFSCPFSHTNPTSSSKNKFPFIKRNKFSRNNECMTAHDWEAYHIAPPSAPTDDGTESFFWRAHSLTALFCLSACLLYFTVSLVPHHDSSQNALRGFAACLATFFFFGVTQTPDGPFKRPHPIVWRFVFCASLVYELTLIFLLFQAPADARSMLKYIDPGLGVPLPEKSYGGDCKIYDPIGNPADPFYNLKDKLDEFVPTHFIGWWFKTLIIRDWWLCTVMSVMFELLEYSLAHQLPNFHECWWDHWILDVLICNGAGIYMGMQTLRYLSMKPYHWRGMWSIPTYGGKLKRAAAQFSPYSWIRFDWRPTANLTRWIATLAIICIFQMAELNTFYLKYVLWLKPTHYLNPARLMFFLLAGAVATREAFQYLDDPKCKKMGAQAWLVGAIIFTEFLVVYKFDPNLVTKPLPDQIMMVWLVSLACLSLYTLCKFVFVIPPSLDCSQFIARHWRTIGNKGGETYTEIKESNESDIDSDTVDTAVKQDLPDVRGVLTRGMESRRRVPNGEIRGVS
ncbi:unnamed protein product [Gordionus sp. m RMFG-2023]|uniref:phosphatidylserine synthase 2-like n=1 Tax=Gordionus sp. m RMFG-2023 TaxID=3053472 RepID=UPI0030E25D83